jgi:hypothetical protein
MVHLWSTAVLRLRIVVKSKLRKTDLGRYKLAAILSEWLIFEKIEKPTLFWFDVSGHLGLALGRQTMPEYCV